MTRDGSTDGQPELNPALPAAVLDPSRGPVPTERQAIYRAELRQGGPPRGWIAQKAREWGITVQAVSKELADAQADLDAERRLEGCQVAAHELTMQAIEVANRIDALCSHPLESERDEGLTAGERAELIEARGKGAESQAKVLKMVGDLKLRSAASLLAIHRRPVVLESGGSGQPQTPDPNKLKSR